jgi:hypothetical protein
MTEASTSFSPAEAFANLSVICSAALSLLFFSELGLARDLDGKYALCGETKAAPYLAASVRFRG